MAPYIPASHLLSTWLRKQWRGNQGSGQSIQMSSLDEEIAGSGFEKPNSTTFNSRSLQHPAPTKCSYKPLLACGLSRMKSSWFVWPDSKPMMNDLPSFSRLYAFIGTLPDFRQLAANIGATLQAEAASWKRRGQITAVVLVVLAILGTCPWGTSKPGSKARQELRKLD